jgi:hypothetical protein
MKYFVQSLLDGVSVRIEEEYTAMPLLFQQSVRLLQDAYGRYAAENEAERTGSDVSALYCVRILVQNFLTCPHELFSFIISDKRDDCREDINSGAFRNPEGGNDKWNKIKRAGFGHRGRIWFFFFHTLPPKTINTPNLVVLEICGHGLC